MTITPNIAGRYRAGHAIDCVVCHGATAQSPDHEYASAPRPTAEEQLLLDIFTGGETGPERLDAANG